MVSEEEDERNREKTARRSPTVVDESHNKAAAVRSDHQAAAGEAE